MFRLIEKVIAPNRRTIHFLTIITTFLLCFPTAGICQEEISISIPSSSLRLHHGERIGGFEVNISGGQIVSFPNIPKGWGICVRNEPDQTARVGGNAIVGSTFLEPSFFNNFISIATYRLDQLKIKITIGTMTDITLKERWFDLNKSDLVLKKLK
ncbi:MAG: hypothetical protein ACP5IL_05895 [Syntrophobacteraceae bacterium]